jgi:hypothetical protein
MEHCIRQNNAIDIYQEYFAESADTTSSGAPAAKSLNIYRYVLSNVATQTPSSERHRQFPGIQTKDTKLRLLTLFFNSRLCLQTCHMIRIRL